MTGGGTRAKNVSPFPEFTPPFFESLPVDEAEVLFQ